MLPGIAFLGIAACFLLLLSILRVEPSQLSFNLLTAAAVASQLVIAIQMLGSMRQLSINWQEPVKQLLEFTKLLTLDLDFIRISCIYGTDSPVLEFVSQLLACPIGCTTLLILQLLTRCGIGRPKPFDSILNLCGLVFFAFFLSITLATLTPFQCVPNPNGTASMATEPGIICWRSEEHTALVLLALAGILSQPGAFLAWTTYTTIMYPSRVASGRGLRLVNRHRFLFHRFKAETYYYGLVVLYRSCFVAILPIAASDWPEVQVPILGAVLIASMALQARTYPWRTEQANNIDLVFTGFLLVILLGAAPLLRLDLSQSTSVLGWMLCVPVCGLIVVGAVFLVRSIVRHYQQRYLFGIFLCHHKGGAGSLCRLMKLMIARYSPTRVFLDCDQLENLDLLFDIVRSSTQSVVVVLTRDLLKRVWCAGEITTAWKNKA